MDNNLILVVDDVEINRLILKEIFKNEYTVLEAENGKVALEIIETEKDNLKAIILDNVMPIMTGKQVLDAMSEKGLLSEIPTVMLTSSGGDDDEIKFLDIGAWDFIMKPFKPAVIKKRVKNLIEQREYSMMKIENARLAEQTKIMNAHKKVDERFRIMCEKSQTVLAEIDYITGERFFTDNISEHFSGEYKQDTRLTDVWVKPGLVKPYDAKKATDFLTNLRDERNPNKIKELLIQMKRKDGTWQWYKMEALYYNGGDGENDRAMLMVNNVDNLMKYQREVENNAEVVNRITSTMNIGMFVCENDDKHTFTFIQDNFCAILGYRRNEIIEKSNNSLFGLVYEGDRESLNKNLRTKFDS